MSSTVVAVKPRTPKSSMAARKRRARTSRRWRSRRPMPGVRDRRGATEALRGGREADLRLIDNYDYRSYLTTSQARHRASVARLTSEHISGKGEKPKRLAVLRGVFVQGGDHFSRGRRHRRVCRQHDFARGQVRAVDSFVGVTVRTDG